MKPNPRLHFKVRMAADFNTGHAIRIKGSHPGDERDYSMKIPIQEKIAELEARIVALEKARARGYTVHRERTVEVDLEPESGRLWKAFDALMDKAFGK